MRVLHLAFSVGPQSYGLGQVVVNLTRAQLSVGVDAHIWSLDPPDVIDAVSRDYGIPRDRFQSFATVGPRALGFSWKLLTAARTCRPAFDVVHQHGIWTMVSMATLTFSRRSRTVIAPHGMLEGRDLQKSRLKKRLAWTVYEAANFRRSSAFHATAEGEREDFLKFGVKRPIALMTNGISDSWLESLGDGDRFRKVHGIPSSQRILLFMSRINPKKGLPLLVEAWKLLSANHAEWTLVLVGGDEDGHKAEVSALLEASRLTPTVVWVDPVFGQGKRDAFSAAELFVLPSHSEGFPMVVLDSLGAGVPVVVTKAAAWQELPATKSGWWVDIDAKAVGTALNEAMSLTPSQLREWGGRGRDLVRDRYQWSSIAEKTKEVYRWLGDAESVAPQHVSNLEKRHD